MGKRRYLMRTEAVARIAGFCQQASLAAQRWTRWVAALARSPACQPRCILGGDLGPASPDLGAVVVVVGGARSHPAEAGQDRLTGVGLRPVPSLVIPVRRTWTSIQMRDEARKRAHPVRLEIQR
jgi:hypothetical protein